MNRLLRLLQATLALLLGFVHFGCGGSPGTEYGAPHATYRVNGTVTSAATGAPIEGIAVTFGSLKTFTDKQGTWILNGTNSTFNPSGALEVKDVDGADHGAFKDAAVALKLIQVEPGNGRWFYGTFEQKDIATKLDPQS